MDKKFLLISYVRDDLRTIGTCYIFSYLKSRGIDVSVLYVNCNIPVDKVLLKNYLDENKFDVIGIRVITDEYFYTVDLINIIRGISPGSLVFLGGGASYLLSGGVFAAR